MNISEASSLYQKLLAQSTRKSDQKLFTRGKKNFDNLQKRSFSNEQMQSIHDTLDTLKLHEGGSKASSHRKKLTKFTNFLKKEFSLVTKGYYASLGLVLGMSMGTGLGVGFGAAFGATGVSSGLAIGIGFGMAIGIVFGNMKDAQAKKEGRVLDL